MWYRVRMKTEDLLKYQAELLAMRCLLRTSFIDIKLTTRSDYRSSDRAPRITAEVRKRWLNLESQFQNNRFRRPR